MPLLYKEHLLLENVRIVRKKNICKRKTTDKNSLKRTEGRRGRAMQTDQSHGSPEPAVGVRWVSLVLHVIFIGKWRCCVGMG